MLNPVVYKVNTGL